MHAPPCTRLDVMAQCCLLAREMQVGQESWLGKACGPQLPLSIHRKHCRQPPLNPAQSLMSAFNCNEK